nr:unnamed protein product [Digitaria exilis]
MAAAAAGYAMLARTMSRELLPDEVRGAVRWAATPTTGASNHLYSAARAYLATRIDPRAMDELRLAVRGARRSLSMVPGDSITDVFHGVEFRWTSTRRRRRSRRGRDDDSDDDDDDEPDDSLVLCFDAEQTDMALDKYVPFIMDKVQEDWRRYGAIQILMNTGSFWFPMTHHHPATFDTLAMDTELKRSIVADLDRFLKRNEYYRLIGKAWKRGYLLHGPPGTGKSSLVAAMANYLHFKLYDLDISEVLSNSALQKLLIGMDNRCILVIEDIDCCFSAKTREEKPDDSESDSSDSTEPPARVEGITLSGLLNFIDGLWSTCGEERIIVFTTNYKERLDPALLRPGWMDMQVYMGYCGWEAFKTLAHNYFLIGDHPLFQEIQGMLVEVEVTPAEVSEMLLRSEDADVALQGLVGFLQDKKEQGGKH